MTQPKDFVAVAGSDARKLPTRVLFVTRRTSAQVRTVDEEQVQTYPEALFRALLAIELLAIGLVLISLCFDAPLEGLADPTNTPNPAKAPWYFLGLQELLHYFPPVVAGVLIPTVFVVALVVIPYFNINIEADGVFLKQRNRRLRIFLIATLALVLFLLFFQVYVALVPTLLVAAFMLLAAFSSPLSTSPMRRYLASKTLSWWIMTWFLIELSVLTAVGTFFRGPGWSWVLPWRS
jgi:phosphoglycerol transferase MdoB-like AlkP superfamily enzyme